MVTPVPVHVQNILKMVTTVPVQIKNVTKMVTTVPVHIHNVMKMATTVPVHIQNVAKTFPASEIGEHKYTVPSVQYSTETQLGNFHFIGITKI
jgi:hypothetical protein